MRHTDAYETIMLTAFDFAACSSNNMIGEQKDGVKLMHYSRRTIEAISYFATATDYTSRFRRPN